MKLSTVVLIVGNALALPLSAQVQPTPLVSRKIDESRLVVLNGSVHPLAQARYDQGPVPDSFSADRMLLLLNRPPDREAALETFLQSAHTKGSPNFHRWLTPAQFGKQFGPADSDVLTAVDWLQSHGFRVTQTSQSRQFIQFSGSAADLRSAFRTSIHQYLVNGEKHYANSSELQIPAALAPLIKGVAPLNDFHAQPMLKVAGPAHISRGAKDTSPQWTAPNSYGTSNPYQFTVAPEDFATQYDLNPLYQAGTNGAGQTIGIINESNIDLSLVQAYQSLFGVAASAPQVIIDGEDPGDISGIDVEAYLDVELAGAIAPKATVDLYIASAGALVDPLELAAYRAVEDNQASVLSVSFGSCESSLGAAGNQFWASLWEQAAAQGQTVLVAAGDYGSECFLEDIDTVNGLASTPWNVAVGGTDFYYSDYATGAPSTNSLWNTTNDANLGSLKAPLPEQPWNDDYGYNIIANGYQRGERAAGGGGASNCITQNTSTLACTSGYAKPAWQSGAGVPADHVRDLPDVSLFASNGANLSSYAVCAFPGECAAGSGTSADVYLVGGTSASTPAMAGIMALVNQKYGRQGQADFTLYPLAQQQPSAFHDITVGNNSAVCGGASNPPNCVLQWNGIYGTPQYPAGPGYDQASGLGSLDAGVLVNNWNSITFRPTATTLQLSNTTVVHGTPITITAKVAPSSGSGTPTGDVAILTNSPLPSSASQLFVPLDNGSGVSTGVNYLPGGEYDLTGRYGGDSTFASSTSQPVALTVTPEASKVNFSITSNATKVPSGGSVGYNSPLQLNVQPAGANVAIGSSDGHATGSASFTVDSTTASVALNSAGIAAWTPPALSVGNHTASASYAGDASFKSSLSSQFKFAVTKGYPYVNMNLLASESTTAPAYIVNPGGSFSVEVEVGPQNGVLTGGSAPPGTVGPTGTVTVCLNTSFNVAAAACTNPAYSQTVPLAAPSGIYSQYSSATVTFPNLAAGDYMPQFTYSGDANWLPWGEDFITTVEVQPATSLAPSTTSMSISPSSISGTQQATLSATVAGTGNATTAPTGVVTFYDDGHFFAYAYLAPAATGAASSVTFSVIPSNFWNSGANQLTAYYSGDTNYAPSVSSAVNLTATQTSVGDFSLAPQTPQLTVAAGSTSSVGVNLASINTFNATVSLACTPSSNQFSCSVNPASVPLSGTATATVSISTTVQTASLAPSKPSSWPLLAAAFGFGIFFFRARNWRNLRAGLLFSFALLFVLTLAGCGSGNKMTKTPPPPGSTPAGTYTLVVTGTANGITHNAKVTVVVP
ncbi:MAG TPA: Ig-like domain repeat protein [Terracidiphilus sp.]|jgi:subtilase family serine protease|nr:Ig-like domain repeat protein [Terracidiphilus sp.]